MSERSLISVFEEKKYLVLVPEGLSKPEMETISTFGIITKLYKENELFKQYEGVTDRYDESLFDYFPDHQKLLFVKNPYWRTLEYYLWKYVYSTEYDNRKTETFNIGELWNIICGNTFIQQNTKEGKQKLSGKQSKDFTKKIISQNEK